MGQCDSSGQGTNLLQNDLISCYRLEIDDRRDVHIALVCHCNCAALSSGLGEQDPAICTDILNDRSQGKHVGLIDWALPAFALDDPVHSQTNTFKARVDIDVVAATRSCHSQVSVNVESEFPK